MRPIVTTLVVYVIAAASVFGLQLLAVTAFLTWRSGGLDLERDGLATLLVGVPASSGALIAIAILAAGRPRRVRLRLTPSRVPPRAIVAMVIGTLALSQALESVVIALGVGRGPALEWASPWPPPHRRACSSPCSSSACSPRSARSCSSGASC
ncbi:MAG TPA: hypothetical protein VFS98_02885 [Methylomirabilota bacterium]|nr:hypothetical protein [Methylomirabilota bacterium]